MSGKFMHVKRIVIPAMTLAIIASTLVGCASATQQELGNLLSKQEAIEITVPTLDETEDITVEEAYKWIELAYLEDTDNTFRETFDDTLGITPFGQNGKNGVVYVDTDGNHTDNSTLHFAFYNEKFLKNCWHNSDTLRKVCDSVKEHYTDIDTDEEALAAILNVYFNLFADTSDGQFHGSDTLSRAEYLAFVYRAENPVSDIEASDEFVKLVDPSGNNVDDKFAEQMVKYSYLGTDDYSLNNATYKGIITNGEAAYTIATMYYADEYAKTTASKDSFDIVQSAKSKKDTTDYSSMNYVSNAELSYAIKNDVGAPARIDRAIQVLNKHGITSITADNWSEPITKQQAIILVTDTYEDLGTKTNADRGNATGENLNSNGDDNVLSGANTGAVVNTYDVLMLSHVTNENGSYVMDDELAEVLMDLDIAKGATVDEVNWWLNQSDSAYFGPWLDVVCGKENEQKAVFAEQRMWVLQDLGDVDYNIHDVYTKAHQSSSGNSNSSSNSSSSSSSNSSSSSSSGNSSSSSGSTSSNSSAGSDGGSASGSSSTDDDYNPEFDDGGSSEYQGPVTGGSSGWDGACINWQ